jgi:hypothetical protein
MHRHCLSVARSTAADLSTQPYLRLELNLTVAQAARAFLYDQKKITHQRPGHSAKEASGYLSTIPTRKIKIFTCGSKSHCQSPSECQLSNQAQQRQITGQTRWCNTNTAVNSLGDDASSKPPATHSQTAQSNPITTHPKVKVSRRDPSCPR